MKIIATIFIFFIAQCMHLDAIDILQIPKHIATNINDTISQVIPSCIFGVKSVSMQLFTRDIPYGRNIDENKMCDYTDPSKRVVFLVHGFISSANTTNSYRLASLLAEKDYIVFSLDWSDAACTNGFPIVQLVGYPSAVENTREIGDFMAKYVTSLIDNCNIPLKNMIFIGHSLGAHITGFAAKKIQNAKYGTVPKLLAADPAEPLFLTNKCDNRLCVKDAKHVIVLHTSALGIPKAIGETDLYFHHGFTQPGCEINVICSHSRAVVYLADMLENNCKFVGIPIPVGFWSSIKGLINRSPSFPNLNHSTNYITISNEIYDDNFSDTGSYYMFVGSESSHCVY